MLLLVVVVVVAVGAEEGEGGGVVEVGAAVVAVYLRPLLLHDAVGRCERVQSVPCGEWSFRDLQCVREWEWVVAGEKKAGFGVSLRKVFLRVLCWGFLGSVFSVFLWGG